MLVNRTKNNTYYHRCPIHGRIILKGVLSRMNDMGISRISASMSPIRAQAETSAKVMNMANDVMEKEGEGLTKMMASMTGVGQNVDISA